MNDVSGKSDLRQLLQNSRKLIDAGQLAEARELLLGVVEKHPKPAVACQLARIALKEKAPELAESYLETHLRSGNPGFTTLHLMGRASEQLNKYQQAAEFYQKAHILEPEAPGPNRALQRIKPHLDGTFKSENKPRKPVKFNERLFVKNTIDMLNDSKSDNAEKHLLENLCALQNCNVNRKEKLNDLLYLTKLIQQKGSFKHGYEKLLRKASSLQRGVARYSPPAGGVFVDLGCGAHDPVALSAYHYLNGYEVVYSIDMKPPRNEVYSALSMYEILANVLMFPQRYAQEGTQINELVSKVRCFNLDAFEKGDFWGGLKPLEDKVRFETCDIVDSTVEHNSVSALVSFAVLEHVDDIYNVSKKIYDAMLPGGIVYHSIDLADHRSYRLGSEFHALSFLAEEEAPPGINRLRASEHLNAQMEAGFELLSNKVVKSDIPDNVRRNLLPKFRAMHLDDVCGTEQYLSLRKPLG